MNNYLKEEMKKICIINLTKSVIEKYQIKAKDKGEAVERILKNHIKPISIEPII